MTLPPTQPELSLSERLFAATGIYALFFASYTLANRTVSLESAVNLTLPVDRAIPFIPEFVYPFYLLYGFIVLPSFLIKSRRLFYRSVAAFSSLIVMSAVIFLLFPVYVPRPEFVPDGLAGNMVASIYRMDRPICGFPSLHVSTSLLATLVVFRNSKAQGMLFSVMFLLTSAATLFIKQHVVLDAAGGIVMALLIDRLFVSERMPSLRPLLKAGRLMVLSARRPPEALRSQRICFTECVTPGGTQYDLYDPVSPAQKTFIVIHGLTLQGEKDARLTAFAEQLAVSGIRTAAIALAGLKQCRFDDADTRAIADLAVALSSQYGDRTGIIGFSFGAGLALVAAAGPEARHLIDPMILFGPYYSLETVQSEIFLLALRQPVSEEEWNNHIWIRLVTVFRNMDGLALDTATRRKVSEMLTHYCHEPSIAVKHEFYETTLRHIDVRENGFAPLNLPAGAALSPENKLDLVQSRVLLLHDYYDALIPPDQSRLIFRELESSGNGKDHRLLITPLLSHVTPGTSLKVFDIFPLLNIFSKIYE
ncbi:MAG: phosphatase PAP2 family protein [Thermodesulfobacteriota bacterium]